jgi:hypothetical protein
LSENTGKPDSIPSGLVSFSLTPPHYGQTVTVTIYLSEPAPANAYWVIYDRLNSWYDYSANAQFNVARDEITL